MIYIKIFNLIYLFSIIRLVFGYNCWYQASVGSTVKDDSSSAQVTTQTSLASLGGLEFEFALSTTDHPKLTDGDGKTYVMAKDGVTELEQEANLADLFGTMSISIAHILVDGSGSDVKAETSVMANYAGTYLFKITVTSGNGKLSFAEPTTKALVGSMGTSDLAIKVVVSPAGAVSLQQDDGTALSAFYFAVAGTDNTVETAESASANPTYAVVTR